MTEFPSNPSAPDLQKVILMTFRVTAEEAHRLAKELRPLLETPETTGADPALNWVFDVKQELAERLPWRSDAERIRFQLDRALGKPCVPELADFIRDGNFVALREAIRTIIRTKRAKADEIETLKHFAASLQPGVHRVSYDSRKYQLLKYEALVAVVALGAGKDESVITVLNRVIEHDLSESRSGLYGTVPNHALLILVAMDAPAAAPGLRSLLNRVSLWSLRVACLYSLPESKQDGTHRLLHEFRSWIAEVDTSKLPANLRSPWAEWKAFITCLALDGLAKLCGGEKEWPQAPPAHFSPLIDWALDHGESDWLANELHWLYKRASVDMTPVRNRLVQRAVPAAVDLCLEQVRNAQADDYTHYDVVHNALRLHPKPMPRAGLEACLEVIRRPSHPSRYEHRIDALNWLVEAAGEGRFPRAEVENLVLDLARNETDPDVRVAAIAFVPWASPQRTREVLTGALSHESARIREAALRAVGQSRGHPLCCL